MKVFDLRPRGIEMLDSPVSGADIGATNGNLTIFVGGNYEAYQRCLPVLQMSAAWLRIWAKTATARWAR